MDQLVILYIENFKQIRDHQPQNALINLEGMAVGGSLWTTQIVESLDPLSSLKNLRYLYLDNLKSSENSLQPLLELKQLVNLMIGYNWSKNEMRLLKENLPDYNIVLFFMMSLLKNLESETNITKSPEQFKGDFDGFGYKC
ncbi:MAG: hypothetical protein JSW42_01885 [Chloroflexota bacterium]|nr:MAG: hypothetical protein JSW42_01885 [Chloroflexota bacterium]